MCVTCIYCVLYCFVCVYLFLFLSVLVEGLLPPSDNSIAVSSSSSSNSNSSSSSSNSNSSSSSSSNTMICTLYPTPSNSLLRTSPSSGTEISSLRSAIKLQTDSYFTASECLLLRQTVFHTWPLSHRLVPAVLIRNTRVPLYRSNTPNCLPHPAIHSAQTQTQSQIYVGIHS
jgi:hypothetical protein